MSNSTFGICVPELVFFYFSEILNAELLLILFQYCYTLVLISYVNSYFT